MDFKGLWVRIFVRIKSSDALRSPLYFASDTDIWKGQCKKTFELMIKKKYR